MRTTRGSRLRPVAAACGCLVTLAFWSSGSLRAQAPPVGHRIAPGPLEIHVVDRQTRKPIRGAVVRVGGRYATTGLQGVGVLDGLPAGSYRVGLDEPGYERLARRLEVPSGRRAPLRLLLVPVAFGTVSAAVVFSDLDLPVSGASLHFEPAAVRAASQGPFDGTTGFDGLFRLLEVPPGRYRVRIEAPGTRTLRRTVAVAGGETKLRFELERTWREAALAVRVTDARTGRPLPAATVELAEAWPLGPVASAQTGADGVASLRGLRVGPRNPAASDGSVSISSGRVTCRVSLAGYATALRTTGLARRGILSVALWPSAEIEATPPSLRATTPQPIPFDTPVRLRIAKVGARRYLRLRTAEPARLRIELYSPELQTYIRVRRASGEVAAERGALPAPKPQTFETDLLAGTYTLELEEWGNNAASKTPLRLTVHRLVAPDAHEPNDQPSQETPVVGGQVLRGALFPSSDVDAYRLDLDRPTSVRLVSPPHALQRYLQVIGPGGAVAATRGASGGQRLDLVASLPAGRYRIVLSEWGRNAASPDPVELRVQTSPSDDVPEPAPEPGRLGAARSLAPTDRVGATINPVGDVDRYLVPLPSAGRLRVRVRGPIELYLRVLTAAGVQKDARGCGAGRAAEVAWQVPGAATAIVEVREWGDNGFSSSPYTLTTRWEPCEESERVVRNETRQAATPVRPGDTVRASISPVGDVDVFEIGVDHPGVLTVQGRAPTEIYLRLLDGAGRQLDARGAGAGRSIRVASEVQRGEVYLEVHEWGDNESSPGSYVLETRLERDDPEETAPADADPPRVLRLGEARGFRIGRQSDRDRFVVSTVAAGPHTLRVSAPLDVYVRVFDDRTGKELVQRGSGAGRPLTIPLTPSGPTRYRVEVEEWGRNGRAAEPCAILLTPGKVAPPIPAAVLRVEHDPTDPTAVRFVATPPTRDGLVAARRIELDANGDGRPDVTLAPGETAAWRFLAEGVFPVGVRAIGAGGLVATDHLWVEATGPRERKGVWVLVSHPRPGEVVAKARPAEVRAWSYTGAPIARVEAWLGGRRLGAAHRRPFDLDLPWLDLGGGQRTVRFVAVDTRGERGELKRTFRLSSYFDLRPADGAAVSGDRVRVAWRAPGFSPARVRLRRRGTQAWTEIVGESSRAPTVSLEGLEPGVAYEWQPLGGGEAGPVRTVTRVKGLAFGRARYGGTIARDYDQKLGITVRNHGEKPATVRLACGAPEDRSRLLWGFVGEGSEGVPFELAPGEERAFRLGLSAQDVIREVHRFPIRLTGAGGLTDEAEVEVKVRLPEVKLVWEDRGPDQDGLGRRYRVRNAGDALTDLDLASGSADVLLDPAVHHATLGRGGRLDVTARPRLFDGFHAADAQLRATAIGKTATTSFATRLPDGERMFAIDLRPGAAPVGGAGEGAGAMSTTAEIPVGAEDDDALLQEARHLAAQALNPGYVDWKRDGVPVDGGVGRIRRWRFSDRFEGIDWQGEDGDADGVVDFVRADVGFDGAFDVAWFRTEDGWERTNLAGAFLELGFRLPWARSKYEPHDVDLVVNGQIVGELRETVPEGNYTFPLPASAIAFREDGAAGASKIEIQSRHLRGGHYVVSSDFSLSLQLTGARVWTPAPSREEAERRALEAPGLSRDGADLSVSSGALRLDAPTPLEKGSAVTVRVPVRNLGAAEARGFDVVLLRKAPGGRSEVELDRVTVDALPPGASRDVALRWKAAAGAHTLEVVADPDGVTGDPLSANNRAMVSLSVAGDDADPTLSLSGVKEGSILDGTVLSFEARAEDDGGVARLEVRVDDGLWVAVEAAEAGVYSVKALLQPGKHRVTVRALDGGGNAAEQTVSVTAKADAPDAAFAEPADGASLDARQVTVALQVAETAALAAVRVNGGPWRRAVREGARATGTLPLRFGKNRVEALVAGPDGAARVVGRTVRCTRQPTEGAPAGPEPAAAGGGTPAEPSSGDGTLDIEGLGRIDLFGPPSTVVPFVPAGREGALRLGRDARREVHFQAQRPRRARGRRGRYLSVRRKQSSWYCTNRPHISTTFTLPDWLRRKKLPKPGTKEYDAMVGRLLARLRARGIDTAALERFQKALERRAGMLEGPEELPTFLQSIGLAGPPPRDEEGLRRWREAMVRGAKAWWVRLLASGDPQLIADGLRARGKALGEFDEAAQLFAEAAITAIRANQKITEDVLSVLPLVGEAMDVVAMATGETLSGDKLTAFDYFFTTALNLGPLGLEQLMKRSPAARQVLEDLALATAEMGQGARRRIGEALEMGGRKVDEVLDVIDDALTRVRIGRARSMDEAAELAAQRYARSRAGREFSKHWDEAVEEGRRLVKNLDEATGPDAFHEAVLALQRDKLAQRAINDADVASQALRDKVNDHWRKIYRGTDADVGQALKRHPDVDAIARRHGVDPKDIEVVPLTITNKRPASDFRSVGRDRDVTYIVVKTERGADGKLVQTYLGDVHHGVSEPAYLEAFWRRTKGDPLPTKAGGRGLDLGELRKHADEMDQAVTSKWHPEAYATGEVQLDDFLDKSQLPTLTRPGDLADTVAFKSNHWFERAKRAGDPVQAARDVGEGMRQATKQYADLVLPRLERYGLEAGKHVPERLRKGMEIFKRVGAGELNPRQAEQMLLALSQKAPLGRVRVPVTPATIAGDLGKFLESVEKTAGASYRVRHTADLVRNLAGKGTGTSIEMINRALKQNQVSGEAFRRLRQQVFRGAIGRATTPRAKEALRTWARRAVSRRQISRKELAVLEAALR